VAQPGNQDLMVLSLPYLIGLLPSVIVEFWTYLTVTIRM